MLKAEIAIISAKKPRVDGGVLAHVRRDVTARAIREN
jgi:hypothetical protein